LRTTTRVARCIGLGSDSCVRSSSGAGSLD
jgi:hypothetical protein